MNKWISTAQLASQKSPDNYAAIGLLCSLDSGKNIPNTLT